MMVGLLVMLFFVRTCVCCFFFVQAEDGIRDLVRSRGLGDVYKRQGFGDINNQVTCSFPGAVVNNGDCDDTDPSISPVALDACLNGDGIDNDCNGQIDEDLSLIHI